MYVVLDGRDYNVVISLYDGFVCQSLCITNSNTERYDINCTTTRITKYEKKYTQELRALFIHGT